MYIIEKKHRLIIIWGWEKQTFPIMAWKFKISKEKLLITITTATTTTKKQQQNQLFGEDVFKLGSSYTAGGNVKWCSYCGKWFGNFSKGWTQLSCNPKSTSSHKPKRNENTCPHKDLYTFVAAQLIWAKKWKQHKCPLTDK